MRKQWLGLSPVCNLAGAYLIKAQIDKLVRKIEIIQEEIKECKKHPVSHNERLRLPGLDTQLGAVRGEKVLLMQQLQGAVSCVCCCSVYHT